MDILVVAPMKSERENFINALKEHGKTHNCYHVISCGVGKIAAARNVQEYLSTNADMRIDMIALVGYAGGGSGFVPGCFVVPDTCTVWDANTPKVPLFEELHKVYSLRGNEGFTVLTGDSFVDRKMGKRLERKYQDTTLVYDMECAAVAAVAERERIPLIVTKIISDVPYQKRAWFRRRGVAFEEFVAKNKDFKIFLDVLEQF